VVNQAQHMPGPWRVEIDTTGSRFRYIIRASENTHVCEVNYHAAPQNIGSLCDLIAAAPELLEVLESALQYIKYNGPTPHDNDCACSYCSIVAKAQHVINKAKGVQS